MEATLALIKLPWISYKLKCNAGHMAGLACAIEKLVAFLSGLIQFIILCAIVWVLI